MDDFIPSMVWQLVFLIRHKLDNIFGILYFFLHLPGSRSWLSVASWTIYLNWLDWVCVQVHCAVQVQVQGETKWNGRSARFEKSETMMLAWTTINRGLSASVRTSISQMQPMAGTMTHGGREPEKCIICFITYFLTCTLRKHINKTQIDNGVGRLSIWRLCPLALGFPSIRCKNTMKIQKNTNNKSYY